MSQTDTIDVSVVDLLGAVDTRAAMIADVRRGLLTTPKELPPKYFYDEWGSQLFERICEVPEYYQTRTESALLASMIDDVVTRYGPRSLAELGSGSSTKTRVILDAMKRHGTLLEYAPIDLSREILLDSAASLREEYPGLHVRAVVADFERELPALESPSPTLMIFLGGTIGNFGPDAARELLERVRGGMRPGDLFLLGVDLVKSPAVLNAAYNDAAGVTAEFNRNVLRVINERLDADFDLDAFEHYAFYDPREEQIEMHLASTRDQTVTIGALGQQVSFYRGETVRTEISRKFTRASATSMLEGAGFDVAEWHTDDKELFGLALATMGT
jgi:L-histidine Nalpha-methyltransferase